MVPTDSIESSGDDGELRSEFVEDREDHVIECAEIVAITNRTLKWKDKRRYHYLAIDIVSVGPMGLDYSRGIAGGVKYSCATLQLKGLAV